MSVAFHSRNISISALVVERVRRWFIRSRACELVCFFTIISSVTIARKVLDLLFISLTVHFNFNGAVSVESLGFLGVY